MEKNIANVGFVLAVSGVFLAYAGLSDEVLSAIPVLSKYRSIVFYAGLAFSIISVPIMLIMALDISKIIYSRTMETVKGRKVKFLDNFIATRVNKDQLSISYELIKSILYKEGIVQVIDFSKFSELWERNNDVYMLIWDVRKVSAPKPIGFINAYPIKAESARSLLSGDLRGRDLKAAHICEPHEIIPAYFIGAIAGASLSARAAIILTLDRKVSELSLVGQFPQVFTVPYTKRGRIIARDYGFRPVRKYKDAELWLRNSPQP